MDSKNSKWLLLLLVLSVFHVSCGGGSDSKDSANMPFADPNDSGFTDQVDREDLDELLSLDGRSVSILLDDSDPDTPLWRCQHSIGLVNCSAFGGVSPDSINGVGLSWDINDSMMLEFEYSISSASSVDFKIPEIGAEYGYFQLDFENDSSFSGRDTRGFEVTCVEVSLEACPYQDPDT